nr:PREDICTED: uncharacterized protein LOC105664042 isoform X2 [Megachile rotundata]
MSDIALIATTRQAMRMFPPQAAFSYIFTNKSHRVGNSVYNTIDLYGNFNFSGHGAFAFYKVFMSTKWKLNLNGATDSQAKQVCYHSMFGTYKEDLGILSQITNQATWDTREELDRIFQKANTTGTSITFEPVKQKFYSKMSQANQTALLTSSYSQLSSIPCFSGKTKRKFSDAFFDHLMSEKSKASGGRSLQSLMSSYTTLRDKLRKLLEKNQGTLDAGTTGWRRIEDVTPTLEGQEDTDMVIQATGRFFLGKCR